MKLYTDEELHKLADDAMEREDRVMAAAITAVGMSRAINDDKGLMEYLLMWLNFHSLTHGKQEPEDENEHANPLTAIDPNRTYRL